VIVNVAPVDVVVTDGALKITPEVAARSMVAPLTLAFPLVNPYTVKLNDDVPSTFNVVEVELITIDETLEFAAVVAGVLAAEVGATAPPNPPPPPQAANASAKPSPATY
jgi:hypothetical protein